MAELEHGRRIGTSARPYSRSVSVTDAFLRAAATSAPVFSLLCAASVTARLYTSAHTARPRVVGRKCRHRGCEPRRGATLVAFMGLGHLWERGRVLHNEAAGSDETRRLL